MNNYTFRASFSILNVWSSGDWQRAIEMYFKLKDFITPAMVIGKQYHKEWQKEIENTKRLPKVFGSKELKSPQTELKIATEMEDWLELVGRIDLIDSPIIYDWKTGKLSSEQYASSKQVGVYAILATTSKIFVDRAEIFHYDQIKKRVDMSVVWLTDKFLKDTYNWINTNASEMHNYLIDNRLYEKFSVKKVGEI